MHRAWPAVALTIALIGCAAPPPPQATDRQILGGTPSQPATGASPAPTAAPTPTVTAAPDEREGLYADRLVEHLAALQAIADAHGGNRATGTPGFTASVDYVARTLEAAGYEPRREPFAIAGTTGTNLLAELPGSEPRVVVVGAHLDSVAAGPGINDNASGVAAVLAMAAALADRPPAAATIRFAFWDAEEGGLHGSTAYVAGLSPSERDRIEAYVNLDMVASPNAVRFVYREADAPAGSDRITAQFAAFFDSEGLAWEPIDLDGDSDHGPFSDAGIPTGGVFTGGIEPVTDAQAIAFDAVAGVPADACSHRACDTVDNVDVGTLESMATAVAHVLLALASD